MSVERLARIEGYTTHRGGGGTNMCGWCTTDQPEGSMLLIRNPEDGPYWVCRDVWLCWVRVRQDAAPWLVGTLTERQLVAL